MTYDLGRYEFVTGPDYTGFNPGNITSILDTRPITVSQFECYRLVIDTSAVPGTLPTIVQTAQNFTGTSLTSLTLTFPRPTTLGNTLVVTVGENSSANIPHVTGMTIGGVADHFGIVSGATDTGSGQNEEIWCDPTASAVGSSIVITFTGGTGSAAMYGFAYEVAGLLNTTTVASAIDVAAHGHSASSTTTNSSTAITTIANDMMIGFGIQFNPSGLANLNTGTSTPTLTDLTPIVNSLAPGIYFGALSSWGLTGVVGQMCRYSMVSDQVGDGAVGFVTLFPGNTGTASGAFPFTVSIDGKTWDQQTTVANQGFAYNSLSQTLFLHEGQNIHIYWPLSVSQYGTYADSFKIVAWFRTEERIG